MLPSSMDRLHVILCFANCLLQGHIDNYIKRSFLVASCDGLGQTQAAMKTTCQRYYIKLRSEGIRSLGPQYARSGVTQVTSQPAQSSTMSHKLTTPSLKNITYIYRETNLGELMFVVHHIIFMRATTCQETTLGKPISCV